MKKFISFCICLAFLLACFTFATTAQITDSYDYSIFAISDDSTFTDVAYMDINNYKAKLVVATSDDLDILPPCTDIVIDFESIKNQDNISSKITSLVNNKTKVYIYSDNQEKTVNFANAILNDCYDEMGFELSSIGSANGFVGCSLETIDTQQIVLTYYFDTENTGVEGQISMILKANSSKLVYEHLDKAINAAQLNTYGTNKYTKIVPTIVCNYTNSEMQSVFNFERIAIYDTQTLWDINNVISLTPKGNYETYSANCWLNVTGGETLIGFGPSASVNSSSASYALSGSIPRNGSGVGLSRSYDISLTDIQCLPEYSSANGTCRWTYTYKAGTTASKGSSLLNNTVRVANSVGKIEIHPATNYIINTTYWLFGWHYGNSSIALHLENQLPGLLVSFNDIK